MEIGNLLFGHSNPGRRFEVSRGGLAEWLMSSLLERTGGLEYDCPLFTIRHYDYDPQCACGYEEAEDAFFRSITHAENCYQTEYHKFEQLLRPEARTRTDEYAAQQRAFERVVNDLCARYGLSTMGSAVHCTCSYRAIADEWLSSHAHSKTCPVVRPNFLHKPTGIEIEWYKYPLRDAWVNKKTTEEALEDILLDCMNYVREYGHVS